MPFFVQLGAYFGDSQLVCFSTRATMELCLAAESRGALNEGWKVVLVEGGFGGWMLDPIRFFFNGGRRVGIL